MDLSNLPAAQLWQAGILRGVYTERSEWAQNDNSCDIASSFPAYRRQAPLAKTLV
jgi:hypothetical protein